jgi:hypothetical protein
MEVNTIRKDAAHVQAQRQLECLLQVDRERSAATLLRSQLQHKPVSPPRVCPVRNPSAAPICPVCPDIVSEPPPSKQNEDIDPLSVAVFVTSVMCLLVALWVAVKSRRVARNASEASAFFKKRRDEYADAIRHLQSKLECLRIELHSLRPELESTQSKLAVLQGVHNAKLEELARITTKHEELILHEQLQLELARELINRERKRYQELELKYMKLLSSTPATPVVNNRAETFPGVATLLGHAWISSIRIRRVESACSSSTIYKRSTMAFNLCLRIQRISRSTGLTKAC